MYDSIDINEIDRINIGNNILLDIRDKYEYNLNHIKNAINIPYNYLLTIPENYLKLSITYYIYCDNGYKSREVCLFLNELGYKVIDLVGGFKKYIDGK